MASYLKYCENHYYAAENALEEALTAPIADPRAIARAEWDLFTAGCSLDFAVQEENDMYDAWQLAEEFDRQEEAWADHEFSLFGLQCWEADPAHFYTDIPETFRGRI